MSVVIDMDMPDMCGHCNLATALCCCVDGKDIPDHHKRREDCPLSEVPAHGRLIDADALISGCKDEKGSYYGHESAIIGEAVESAPTVIEAGD